MKEVSAISIRYRDALPTSPHFANAAISAVYVVSSGPTKFGCEQEQAHREQHKQSTSELTASSSRHEFAWGVAYLE